VSGVSSPSISPQRHHDLDRDVVVRVVRLHGREVVLPSSHRPSENGLVGFQG